MCVCDLKYFSDSKVSSSITVVYLTNPFRSPSQLYLLVDSIYYIHVALEISYHPILLGTKQKTKNNTNTSK